MIGSRRRLMGLPAILLALALWEVLPRSGLLNPVFMPPCSQVAWRLWGLLQRGELLRHCGASLLRVLLGFGLAAAVAIPLGVLLGLHRRLYLRLAPLVGVLRPISPPAWIPLAILWFGIGNRPAVFIIFVGSAASMLLGIVAGARGMDRRWIEASLTLGASRKQAVLWVVLPALLPSVMTQLRIGLGLSWMAVIAAEMVAVNQGLGYMMVQARNLFQTDTVLAGMVVVGALGWGLDRLLLRLERRLLGWRAELEPHDLLAA